MNGVALHYLVAVMMVATVAVPSSLAAELVAQSSSSRAALLPVEGAFPSLTGATEWLNSRPLTPAALRGKVVLVDFWTYTCINWQRTQPYVRLWADKYRDDGLVVIGVHTPEFEFEKRLDNIRPALERFRVTYPVAVDSNYGVWNAFDNQYWPAVYLIDANGKIRYHHFGEGAYEDIEAAIQHLLREAGYAGKGDDTVRLDAQGSEVEADWESLRSEENYLGSDRTQGFASSRGRVVGKSQSYTAPTSLRLNRWTLTGDWTVNPAYVLVDKAHARLVYRFHARDVHLVMGRASEGAPVRFRVLLDGHPPGDAHGADTDDQGFGAVSQQRLYQLIRQSHPIDDRTFQIEFFDSGVEAYAFTFG